MHADTIILKNCIEIIFQEYWGRKYLLALRPQNGYEKILQVIILILYISGSPYVNSMTEVKGFDAKKHFCKVVDVWQFGWDEKLGTVPPEKINFAALEVIKKFPTTPRSLYFEKIP